MMLLKNVAVIVLLFLCSLHLNAQSNSKNSGIFQEGEKVNFIGNSITHGGEFHTNIMLFYATRFPNRQVTFYNSGIWGDNVSDIKRRLETDILPKKADWSVLMAGMNDVNRSLYAASRQGEPNLEAEKQRHLQNYRHNLEAVIQELLKTGTNIILQKPSIYDQTGQLPAENFVGVNDALQKCTVIIDELAQKYGLRVVDYFTLMQDLNQQLQRQNPKATVISNDRIHPGALGSFIMAYQFLKETGAPAIVSSLEIKNGKVRSCQNAAVSNIKKSKERLRFNWKAYSLPFPVAEEAKPALELVPFTQQMNVEQLKVGSLKSGTYSLEIDGVEVGKYTSEQLETGINLALNKQTPQYRQALRVRQLAEQHRQVQKQLRDLKLVEVRYLPREVWNAKTEEREKAMEQILEDLQAKNDRRYQGIKNYFENYRKNKPQEQAWEMQSAQLMKQIREESQPVVHQYELTLQAQ